MQFRIGSHLLVADVQREERLPSGSRQAVIVFEIEGDEPQAAIMELLTAAREQHGRTESRLVSEDADGSAVYWELGDAVFTVQDRSTARYRHTWTLGEAPG